MSDIKQRAKNAMIGLAIGDSISWTSMFHRSVLLPPWTRRIRREIDAASETTNVIVTPMPFSLNQPAKYFNISPTDETEWAAFSAEILLTGKFDSYEQRLFDEWTKLANPQSPIRGGVSTQAAINNLRNGLKPPQSGKQNPHYFDDGAMSRAVPIGIICAGQPEMAARLAEMDAAVTNSEDGVWAAQALAVAISLVCSGKSVNEAINEAYKYLPESSWIRRTVDEAMSLVEKNDSVFSILPEIQNKIVNREYSYGNVAPETLALTFIIAKLHGSDFEKAIASAACFAKSGETLPAMVGALVGAMQSKSFVSDNWLSAIETLNGICIPSFAGKNYLKIVEDLSNQAGEENIIMKISWLDLSDRIKYELQQREEEGNDVSELRAEWNALEDSSLNEEKKKVNSEKFYHKLENFPFSIQNEINEPSEWNEILQITNAKPDSVPSFTSEFIEDRILGGWLGRSAGCLLGKPIEKTPRSGIKELLTSNNTWPIKDYITGRGISDILLKKYPWNKHSGKESLKENIECMTEDDDMNYPMINLLVFEKFGEEFLTEHIIQTWMENFPSLSTFTAERVAYANTIAGFNPPETALIRNPYREWIGAQIRADFWGWISPSQPIRAAEFAWQDARLSHARNGIYGELFFASAISLAFQYNDVKEIITKALDVIPPKSRLVSALNYVLSLPVETQSWEETVDALYEKFGKYHWVHTINNASLVVAALISSKGDFETAICNVVMGGWDTDSNGATVGSIMGTMMGAKNLPSKWINPLNNKIRSSLKGFDNSLLSDLSKRTSVLAKYKS